MYGLVLEGGGAKGSYHMGVYEAILEEGIEIKAVAGTSIGALNGAMIVQGDHESSLKLWNKVAYTDVIKGNEEEIERLMNSKLNIEDLKLISKNVLNIISQKGFDITPFKNLINEYIDEEKVRASHMDFGIVTINLSDMKPVQLFVEDIPEGKLTDYLLASSYLPVFKFERLDGKLYLDGGFYDNLPFKLLQGRGYEDLILVRTHAKGLTRKIENLEGNIITVAPSRDIGRSFIYDKHKMKANIKMGYYDALKVFRGLKGDLYYIEPGDEDYYLQYLLGLNNEQIIKISNKLGISSQPSKRVLLEYIVPNLASFVGLKEDFTYEELIINLLEKKALDLNIEEYKIYKFEELLSAVKEIEVIEEENIENIDGIEKILKKIDLAKYFNRDEIILDIADIIFRN